MRRDDTPETRVEERFREAMLRDALGGHAVAARVGAELDARGTAPASGFRRLLRSASGRWALRIAAGVAFLVVAAWYGLISANRVATDLTPPVGRTVITPTATARVEAVLRIQRAGEAFAAEMARIKAEGDRLSPVERATREAAARERLKQEIRDATRDTKGVPADPLDALGRISR